MKITITYKAELDFSRDYAWEDYIPSGKYAITHEIDSRTLTTLSFNYNRIEGENYE